MRVLALFGLAACQGDIADVDGAFYDGDGRAVHCAVNLDMSAGNDLASIDGALDRAAARNEVVELYAHKPGKHVSVETIEHVLDGARDRGLSFFTYADFAAGRGDGPGLALSFDDTAIAAWHDLRPMFDAHGAKVTFFITHYATLYPDEHALLHDLAVDGHDIEAHSVNHLRAPAYVEEHGLAAYVADEVVPSIDVLREEGFEIHAYAYPYGARTDELDRALLAHVPILRSVSFTYGAVASPCPR